MNTTDSAVRITHLPTGIVVSCQNERSQHQNKSVALRVLQAKLKRLEQDSLVEGRRNSTIGLGDNSWGNQIKSVVLHPYTIVKDHRCSWESSNAVSYLKGSELLGESIKSYLVHCYDNRIGVEGNN